MNKRKDPFAGTYEGGGVEEINNGPSEIVEEFIEFPEEEMLGQINNGLVRMDMNIIEYPLFSKNRKRKINQTVIYYFNERKDKFIEVKPIAGSSIPGELEEKVFISLIKIMRKYHYGRNFVVTNAEIMENMSVTNRGTKNALHSQVKEAMLRLTETSYTFKNSLYSNELGGLIENAVVTNIMNIEIISRKNVRTGDKGYFTDGRISEVYRVSLSDHFYNNIIRRGYLIYDANVLLNISTSTARGIYLLITKWRFHDLYLKKNIITLLKRIPLKYDSKNIGRSIKTIENACMELKEKKLINDFKLIKHKKLEEAEIEFFFSEEHNRVKQDNFYEDRGHFNQVLISHTEEKPSDFEFAAKVQITEEMIEEIFKLLPEKARDLKTMPRVISESIKQHGLEKVEAAASYTKRQKAKSIRSYFLQTLENNWAEDEIVIKQEIRQKPQAELPFESSEDKELKRIKELFLQLPEDEKSRIEEAAKNEHLAQNKFNIKGAEVSFKHGKLLIISQYLKDKNYFAEEAVEAGQPEVKIPEEKEAKSPAMVKEIIDAQINVYADVFGLGEDEKFELKFEVANILITEKIQDSVTEDKLKKIIKQVLKNL